MAEDGILQGVLEKFFQYSMILSALAAFIWGYYTWSFKKMIVTYIVGVLCSMLVVIPDWAFFKRPPSEWGYPMPTDKDSAIAQKARFQILNKTPNSTQRFNFYPLRMIVFILSYGYMIYKTVKYITS